MVAVDDLADRLRAAPARYTPATAPDDLALFQYTSGTTRALPEAVRHTHRSVVTLMVAALYGVGLRAGDRYFCPSSPAWGHGLWHGTVAPLAARHRGGQLLGQVRPERIVEALDAFRVTNLAAAPTVYRMIRESGAADRRPLRPEKLSFTGEPMDDKTWDYVRADLRPDAVQHVRQHRGRGDHRELSGLRGLRGPPRRARQGRAGLGGRGGRR